MDARLPWHQRVAMRLHLLYCVWCRRYANQLQLLRKAARDLHPEELPADSTTLSSQAKEQMRSQLQKALKEPRPSSE